METSLFEIRFWNGRKYRVFCQGKNQIKRFLAFTAKKKESINTIEEISSGIHTISQFEKITTNSPL